MYFKKMVQGILFILRRGDLNTAVENAMIYELHPLAIGSGITQPGASRAKVSPKPWETP